MHTLNQAIVVVFICRGRSLGDRQVQAIAVEGGDRGDRCGGWRSWRSLSNSIKISLKKIYLDLMGNFCGWQGDFSVALSELLAAALRYRIKSVG